MSTAQPAALAIEARSLSKSFGPRPVLRGLDLSVEWGVSLAIFGPNGSGKTTLMKVLATLLRPSGGTVRIAGLDLRRDANAVRRLLGAVTHQTYLYDDLTGYENLRFYARMYGLPDAHDRILALARELGLADHLTRRVRTLSHGTQKRFSLARALLHRPTLLLLDEPETGLDQDALAMLAHLLRGHQATGGTVVMATHNVERGLAMADQVAILSGGRIAFQERRDALDNASFRDTYARLTGVRA